jgi:hypothetical protein
MARVCLIERNRLKNFLADKRYADYLGVPVTGELGNIDVESGSLPYKTMTDAATGNGKPIYHLQAFSAFEPNAITGAFSAEIKAGYEISSKGINRLKGGPCPEFCSETCWIAVSPKNACNASVRWLPKVCCSQILLSPGIR